MSATPPPRCRIAPSILSADFGHLARDVAAVAAAGADLIHVDVMDGHFVPNLTIGPPVVAAVRAATTLPLDVHLMVSNPDALLEEYVRAGANLVSVHVEACPHLHRTLQRIRSLGARPSVACNPATSLEGIRYVLEDVDMVLLMTVNPGFGGQSFIPAVLDKVRALRDLVLERGLAVDIEVDGGVAPDTVGAVTQAGANVIVAGSAIFARPPFERSIAALRAGAIAPA